MAVSRSDRKCRMLPGPTQGCQYIKKSAIRTSGVVANYSCVHFLYVFDCTLFNDAAPNSDHLAPSARLKMRVTGIGILVYS